MVVSTCNHESHKKHGKDRNGNQRFRCQLCGKTWIEKQEQPRKPLGNMRISMKAAVMVLKMLLEGMSVRAASRITGMDCNTICDLILTVGENCQRLMNSLRDIKVEDVQADEIWSFVGCKEKVRQLRGYDEEFGDSWTYIAIERNTKMVLAYEIGSRDHEHTVNFLKKLDRATTGKFQLSTDGLSTYTNNVPFTFGNRVDYGQLVKNYQSSQVETRYSPATIISSEKKAVFGSPAQDQICTSHIESFNQKYRSHLRRFTRLTNAHSKSLKHHEAMQAIYFAFYNWCRVHETLKETPAMASQLSDTLWTVRELVEKVAQI